MQTSSETLIRRLDEKNGVGQHLVLKFLKGSVHGNVQVSAEGEMDVHAGESQGLPPAAPAPREPVSLSHRLGFARHYYDET